MKFLTKISRRHFDVESVEESRGVFGSERYAGFGALPVVLVDSDLDSDGRGLDGADVDGLSFSP